MNKAELIMRVAQEASLTRPHAAQVLAAFLGQVQAALRSGERVRLVGFRAFAVRQQVGIAARR
jgi:nucleoid DNA-binding protein